MTGCLVLCRVEGLGRVMERNAQLVERPVLAGEIFVHEMFAPDVTAVDPVFPAAVDVVGRVPQAVPRDVAEPGEPPVDHLGATAGHAGEACDHPLAVLELLVTGLERQVAWLQKFVRFFEPHVFPPGSRTPPWPRP